MYKLCTSLFCLAFLAFFSSSPLQANIPVVSWGLSPDYVHENFVGITNAGTVTNTIELGPDSLSTGFRARYFNETAVSSASYTVAPDSPNFRFAIALSSGIGTTSAPGLFTRVEGRASNSPAGDAIQLSTTTSSSGYSAAIIWWSKDEFLGGFTAAPLSSTGTSITIRNTNPSHIVIQNGNDWFISETVLAGIASNDTTTTSGTIDLTSQNWASYDPTGSTFYSLFANPATIDNLPQAASGLTFSPQMFEDIQSIGIYSERIANTGNRSLLLSEFNVVAIPEPSTFAFIFSSLLIFGVLNRRLKK